MRERASVWVGGIASVRLVRAGRAITFGLISESA
jgi:hypothetical protein